MRQGEYFVVRTSSLALQADITITTLAELPIARSRPCWTVGPSTAEVQDGHDQIALFNR